MFRVASLLMSVKSVRHMFLDMLNRMFFTLAFLLHQWWKTNVFLYLNAKFIPQPSMDDLKAAVFHVDSR